MSNIIPRHRRHLLSTASRDTMANHWLSHFWGLVVKTEGVKDQ